MDTVEFSDNTYFYRCYWNLDPAQLFNLIMLDALSERLGIEIAAAVKILAGQPWLPTRQKPGTAVKGTSAASVMMRKLLLDSRLPQGIRIYTPIGNIRDFRMVQTNKVGAITGRYVPWLGWAEALWIAQSVGHETRKVYNIIARPEDRIAWTYF